MVRRPSPQPERAPSGPRKRELRRERSYVASARSAGATITTSSDPVVRDMVEIWRARLNKRLFEPCEHAPAPRGLLIWTNQSQQGYALNCTHCHRAHTTTPRCSLCAYNVSLERFVWQLVPLLLADVYLCQDCRIPVGPTNPEPEA
jgi:hypothetical protein